MNLEIKTERLLLTPLTVNDGSFILELVNTEGWFQFIGDRDVHSENEATGYIKKILEQPDIQYWVVRLAENDMAVGIITWIKRAYLEHPDIGFAFLPVFANNGYAFEATKAVLEIVSDSGDPVLSITRPDNSRAIKLLNKLDFRFEEEILVKEERLKVYKLTNQ